MKACNKYDFVYILKDITKNEELKYSLRSIEANASNLMSLAILNNEGNK